MNIKEAQEIHTEAIKRKDHRKIIELLEFYNAHLNVDPDNIAYLFLVATCHLQLGNNGIAINLLNKVVDKQPELPEAWNNLGSAWKSEHNNEKAIAAFTEAVKLKQDPDFYNNLATLYINEGDPAPGVGYAQQAIDLDFNHGQAHWNLGLLLLEMGKFKDGFLEYDFGLVCGERPISKYDPQIPMWEGQKNKRVVIYGEQGIGDEILFASCIPDLLKDCKEVVIDGHPRMVEIYKQSFPNLRVYGNRKKIIKQHWDEKLDYMLPMGSLLRKYRSDGHFPKTPYLKADPAMVDKYRKILAELGPGPYIGISWRGGAKKTRIDLRSTKVRDWLPVVENDATFVSLQYTDDAHGKLERWNKDNPTIHYLEAPQEKNYMETAALVEALDLVISVNTAVVHLCGALGKECWTLTPRKKAWRYFDDGSGKMFAYDTVTMFQNKEDNWTNIMEKIAVDLKKFIGKRAAA